MYFKKTPELTDWLIGKHIIIAVHVIPLATSCVGYQKLFINWPQWMIPQCYIWQIGVWLQTQRKKWLTNPACVSWCPYRPSNGLALWCSPHSNQTHTCPTKKSVKIKPKKAHNGFKHQEQIHVNLCTLQQCLYQGVHTTLACFSSHSGIRYCLLSSKLWLKPLLMSLVPPLKKYVSRNVTNIRFQYM